MNEFSQLRPADTSEGAWEVYMGMLRAATPGQRFAMAMEMSELVRNLRVEAMRKEFPGASEQELGIRLLVATVEPRVLREAFGWE